MEMTIVAHADAGLHALDTLVGEQARYMVTLADQDQAQREDADPRRRHLQGRPQFRTPHDQRGQRQDQHDPVQKDIGDPVVAHANSSSPS